MQNLPVQRCPSPFGALTTSRSALLCAACISAAPPHHLTSHAVSSATDRSAQTIDERGQPVWTVIYQIPHRELTADADFVELSSANGTTVTLSGSHMVYVTDAVGLSRVLAAARDVQVCQLPVGCSANAVGQTQSGRPLALLLQQITLGLMTC